MFFKKLEKTVARFETIGVYIFPSNQELQIKAQSWNVSNPFMIAHLKIIRSKNLIILKIIKSKNYQIFAETIIENYPSPNLVSVSDSRRYFMLKTNNNKEHPFIGIGFQKRHEASLFLTTFQSVFKTEIDQKDLYVEYDVIKTKIRERCTSSQAMSLSSEFNNTFSFVVQRKTIPIQYHKLVKVVVPTEKVSVGMSILKSEEFELDVKYEDLFHKRTK